MASLSVELKILEKLFPRRTAKRPLCCKIYGEPPRIKYDDSQDLLGRITTGAYRSGLVAYACCFAGGQKICAAWQQTIELLLGLPCSMHNGI